MKTTFLLTFLLAVSAVLAQTSYLVQTFSDSGCTNLLGLYFKPDELECVPKECTQWGSSGQYYNVECGIDQPETPAYMHSFSGNPFDETCSELSYLYAGIPNQCWVLSEGLENTVNSILMSPCVDGSIPFSVFNGAGLCETDEITGTISSTCAMDSVITLQYAVATCATAEVPVAAPTSSNGPTGSAAPSSSAPTSTNAPAKQSDAATMTVSGLMLLVAALI